MSGRTRILFVITELEVGGAEKTLFELARRLPREEFDPTVVSLTGHGEVGRWLDEQQVPVHPLEMRGRWDVGVLRRLNDLVASVAPQVLHSFLYHGALVCSLAKAPATTKRIWSLRVPEQGIWRRLLLRRLHRRVDAVSCVSEGVRAFARDRIGIPSEKLVMIRNGVDPGRYQGIQPTLRTELRQAPDVPLLLSVGRLDPQKGMETLIRAARILAAHGVRFAMAIAGDGPLRGRFERMITELGLAGRVRLLGWRREVAELIAGADLFVLSSRWEGMPNVVLEAMACGRPVVATDIPGTAELVVPDVTGLLVPRDDPGALAAAIERLLHNQQLAASLGSSGRERARQVFPLAAMVRQNVELYRRILADPSVTSSPADSPPGT